MKITNTIILIAFLFSNLGINAQKLSQKEQERENNEVEIFTSNERDNLQMWFYNEVNKMNLTEDNREEYYSIVLYYNIKMKRLDDKDSGNTNEEIVQKQDELLKKQNAEIKKILTKEQYELHIKNYDELMRSVRNRMAKTKN